MGKYQAYEKYKDSGIEWLGEIPQHWHQKRLKFSVDLISNKIEAENSNLPYMGLEHIESWTGKRIADDNALSEGVASHFRPDDVLFGKLRPYLAKVYLSEIEGLASTEALVLRSKEDVFSKFLKYYVLSRDFINIVDSSTFGAKMPRASWDFIGNLFLTIPPLPEQQAIANFLDYKTKQIDALINKKETLLEKLDEKRTAIISHAVTKGLDPNVPMKDSGIEWLGEIPEHWEVCHIKRVANVSYGVGGEIDKGLTNGINLLSLPNITQDGILIIDDFGFCELNEQEKKPALLKKGDLLFNWRNGSSSHLGKTAYFDLDGEWTHVSFLLRIRFNTLESESKYFQYMLNGLRITGFFRVSKAGVNNTFNLNELNNLKVIYPPISEQKTIANFLDDKTQQIDLQKAKIQQAIDRLKEYRTALITNAVTGKIDVRQVPIP